MFTGIVEEIGTVLSRQGERVRIECSVVLEDVVMGASIAVSGVCLTVVGFDVDQGWWDADISDETFSRTSLGTLDVGTPVNLERPVRASDRLGGHIVQGHVDGVGIVKQPAPNMEIEFDANLSKYVVEKGSITIDGVSLTVVDANPNSVTVALIPHTCEVTTLGRRGSGDPVNVEVDVNAKHIERLVAAHLQAITPSNGASS